MWKFFTHMRYPRCAGTVSRPTPVLSALLIGYVHSLRGYSQEPVAVSTITLEYFAIPLAKHLKPNARCVQSFWGYFALFGLTGPT